MKKFSISIGYLWRNFTVLKEKYLSHAKKYYQKDPPNKGDISCDNELNSHETPVQTVLTGLRFFHCLEETP